MRHFWKWFPWVLCVAIAYLYWGKITFSSFTPAKTPDSQQLITTPKTSRSNTTNGLAGVVSYSDAVKRAAPAVVNIFTTQKVSMSTNQQLMMQDPAFRRFFGIPDTPSENENKPTSLGSGVIVNTKGYILTNNHVVEKADTIVVALNDGRRADAKVIGTDPESDLAVIKIELDNLPALPFEQHENLVGDVVLAIGNPFGVGQTVTQGIISATGRSGLGINAFEDFIQTDAAINPGNSGGALIDAAGNLVGINTAIFSKSGGNMGIGFAIPVSLAQNVMDAIIQKGKVTRGWLGIEIKGMDDPAAAFSVNTAKTTGAQVMGVVNNGPADKGGLKAGDIIQSINGQPIKSAAQLMTLVSKEKPNARIDLLVERQAQSIKMSVVVGERPKQSEQNTNNQPDDSQENRTPQGNSDLERFLFDNR